MCIVDIVKNVVFRVLELLIVVVVIYFVIIFILLRLVGLLEKKLFVFN